jgi:hypothetical protein
MKAAVPVTYTAACPRCGHDTTWTTTAHDTTTSTLMPTAVSITDGGNCPCAAPAGDVAA